MKTYRKHVWEQIRCPECEKLVCEVGATFSGVIKFICPRCDYSFLVQKP